MPAILVIDDDVIILEVIGLFLRSVGYHVETEKNGAQGIRKFDEMPFDAVITDMEMPERNGNEVALHIRNSKRPYTRIIGISGNPWLFKESLFDLLLSKSFSKKQLTHSVMNLLNAPGNADTGGIKDVGKECMAICS